MSKPKSRNNVQIFKYQEGNAAIDRLREPDEEVWIVNGTVGRKVLILEPDSTEDDAWLYYQVRWMNRIEDEPVGDEEDGD